jgi:ferredoxin-NADP reductase
MGPTYTSRVTGIREVAPDVREIVVAPPGERLDYAPGQWLSLHLPVGEKPPLVRAYSLAAAPRASGELVLCLDRVPEGLASEYLFGVVPGDTLTFSGPLGNFVLPEEGSELLWLARYTGIVPFRAMLQHLEQHPPGSRVRLVYGAARRQDLAYLDELRDAVAMHHWFEMVPVVEEADEGWMGLEGTVEELIPPDLTPGSGTTPMICGKREFVRPLRDLFYARGFDRKAVKWENYD